MAQNTGFFLGTGNHLEDGRKEYSKELTKDQANTIITRAETSGKDITLKIDANSTVNPNERILGFNFDANDVLDVLKNGADGIYVAIGEHKAGQLGKNVDGYTLVLYGTKNGNVLETNKIFDYSKPCPCNCPRTGQTC